MKDPAGRDLLMEIETRHRRPRFHRWWLGLCVIGLVAATGQAIPALTALAVGGGAVGTPLLWILDRRRKAIELLFDLDAEYGQRYQQLLAAFKSFSQSHRVWCAEAEAEVRDRKYHAGATRAVRRLAITPAFKLPPYFKSNVTPAMLPAGRQMLYLFPDTILVFDGDKVGVVGYDQLDWDTAVSPFVEDEAVPRDSRQLSVTWRYVNKSGGPDRRFRDNPELPVMEYGIMRWRTATGLNEEFHTSRAEAVRSLASGLQAMKSANARRW